MLTHTKIIVTTLSFAFAIPFIVAGCGGTVDKGPKRYQISGTVTFDGKPVPFGAISFTPDTKKGNDGPMGFTEIIDGKFNTASNGKGIVGGPHQVTITGANKKGTGNEDAPPVKPLFKPFKIEFNFPKKDTTKDFVVK